MRFEYPAELRRTGPDEIVVSFRDLPECLTSGADEADAIAEASDALEEAVAGRIDDHEPIPLPSNCRPAEYRIAVPPGTAAKAALSVAERDSGLSRSALARRLGVDEKVVRRMLDPRHGTAEAIPTSLRSSICTGCRRTFRDRRLTARPRAARDGYWKFATQGGRADSRVPLGSLSALHPAV